MTQSETELGRRFDLRTESFHHGALRWRILLPRSADELIDVSDFNQDERLPYWADLWPSACALTRFLLDDPPATPGAIEVGCGLALPSLALRSLGLDVLATDYYPEAIDFARANAEINGIPPLRVRLLDWRDPPADLGRFELVLAADVLYERRNAESLALLLPRVTAPGGRVWLADPGRAYLGVLRDLLAAGGWTTREIARREEPATRETTSLVRIWELRPPAG